MSTNTPKETPRERRKKKAEESVKKRNTPKVKSVGKSSPANSFVPSSEDAPAPQIPTGSAQIERVEDRIGNVQAVQQNAVTGIDVPTVKAPTLSSMLAPVRGRLEEEKTAADKMKKYYALADAFNALGRMGGAAIGGAIGGNVLDSAPIVGAYEPSRGYITAFEDAKRASDRLRDFDEKSFQLSYNKQQRDEDRAYNEKIRQADRKYQEDQRKLDREWQQAVADKNLEERAKIEREMAELTQNHKKEILAIQNSHKAADDARSLRYLHEQHSLYNAPQPVMFNDGSIVEMTPSEYESMMKNYINHEVGEIKITRDNFDEVLRANPGAFEGYLKYLGKSVSKPTNTSNAARSNVGVVVPTAVANTGAITPVVIDNGRIDAAKVAQAEQEALRDDVGIHGIPFMTSGSSGYSGGIDSSFARPNIPSRNEESKDTTGEKKPKYSKEDLEFMSQFE